MVEVGSTRTLLGESPGNPSSSGSSTDMVLYSVAGRPLRTVRIKRTKIRKDPSNRNPHPSNAVHNHHNGPQDPAPRRPMPDRHQSIESEHSHHDNVQNPAPRRNIPDRHQSVETEPSHHGDSQSPRPRRRVPDSHQSVESDPGSAGSQRAKAIEAECFERRIRRYQYFKAPHDDEDNIYHTGDAAYIVGSNGYRLTPALLVSRELYHVLKDTVVQSDRIVLNNRKIDAKYNRRNLIKEQLQEKKAEIETLIMNYRFEGGDRRDLRQAKAVMAEYKRELATDPKKFTAEEEREIDDAEQELIWLSYRLPELLRPAYREFSPSEYAQGRKSLCHPDVSSKQIELRRQYHNEIARVYGPPRQFRFSFQAVCIPFDWE